MNEFLKRMTERAKACPGRVGFPEADSPDILKTAEQVVATGIGTPVLVGEPAAIGALAAEHGVSTAGFEYFVNTSEENRAALAAEYAAKFEDFSEKAVARKSKDPLRCAMFLLKLGKVDCVAGGKNYSTGDVVFEAIGIVGLQEGVESPSSLGIADIPGFEGPEGQMLAIADCAITAQPDAADLAGIAISSADTVRTLLGWEPRLFHLRQRRAREPGSGAAGGGVGAPTSPGCEVRRRVPAGRRHHPQGGRQEGPPGKRRGRQGQRAHLP